MASASRFSTMMTNGSAWRWKGLVNPDNFDLFLMWYAFGGTERGIGLLELTQLPADTITDFQYILRRLSEIRSIETSDKPS
jgi:hypothetical protein